MPGPIDLPAWQALEEHQREMAEVHMRDLFAQDPQRFERFSLRLGDPDSLDSPAKTCRSRRMAV